VKGKFFIECAVRIEALEFKKPILGYNEFSCYKWEHVFFENTYTTGNGQDLQAVVQDATDALILKYGKKNIIFKCLYNDNFNGEKLPMII
jgi:hypothetical protein